MPHTYDLHYCGIKDWHKITGVLFFSFGRSTWLQIIIMMKATHSGGGINGGIQCLQMISLKMNNLLKLTLYVIKYAMCLQTLRNFLQMEYQA